MDNAMATILAEHIVPGFGFCFLVRYHARRAGLRGVVQYLPTGDAEIIAEGARDRIAELAARVRAFPAGAEQRNVVVEWGEYTGRFETFDVVYSSLATTLFYD